MTELLRIAIVPVENIFNTSSFIVLTETLLAAILRLELRIILLNQIKLYYCLVGLKMRKVIRWLCQVMQVLRASYRETTIMWNILHRLGLRLGCSRMLDTKLVKEIMCDYSLTECNRFIIVLCINESLLNSILNRLLESGFVIVNWHFELTISN